MKRAKGSDRHRRIAFLTLCRRLPQVAAAATALSNCWRKVSTAADQLVFFGRRCGKTSFTKDLIADLRREGYRVIEHGPNEIPAKEVT